MAVKSNLLNDMIFLTDGGLETTLVFHYGIQLNHFAAFELLRDKEGRQALTNYYIPYLNLAARYGTGFILETPTWRSNPEWGFKLGYSHDELETLNRDAVYFVKDLAARYGGSGSKILISGNIGPRGDGYKAETCMTPEEAQSYHENQVRAFASSGVDLTSAITLNYSDEAIGVVRAARSSGLPVVISFTVETDGKLPNGESLQEAIERTDKVTQGYVEYFMVNCAHPQHFRHMLDNDAPWRGRVKGIRANASTKSHAELDESTSLDAGDRQMLAQGYSQINDLLPDLKVIGGCCGTDHSHVEEICKRLLAEKHSSGEQVK